VRFGLLVKMMTGGVTGWLIAQSRCKALQLHDLIPLLGNLGRGEFPPRTLAGSGR
jgi:hypothetical protein